MISVNDLIALVQEVESQDSIDWGMLNIDEGEALRLIAMDVIEMFPDIDVNNKREVIMLVTVTKLILENFVLNLKIHGKQ